MPVYLTKDCIEEVFNTMHESKKNEQVEDWLMRVKPVTGKNSIILMVEKIEVLSEEYARIIVTDGVKKAYLFIDLQKTNMINKEESFVRPDQDVNYCLLEGTCIILDEWVVMHVANFAMELNKGKGDSQNCVIHEDIVLQSDDSVKYSRTGDLILHTWVVSECSVIGHINTKKSAGLFTGLDVQKQEQISVSNKTVGDGTDSLQTDFYKISELNPNIKNSCWSVNMYLVDIAEVKEFPITNSTNNGNILV
jgi:hypothetical protein